MRSCLSGGSNKLRLAVRRRTTLKIFILTGTWKAIGMIDVSPGGLRFYFMLTVQHSAERQRQILPFTFPPGLLAPQRCYVDVEQRFDS